MKIEGRQFGLTPRKATKFKKASIYSRLFFCHKVYMAHAKPEHLNQVPVLLEEIRKKAPFKEKSLGCFYYKSKGVLHFHIKGERFYTHAFDGKDWNEVDIELPTTQTKQKLISKTILNLVLLDEN